MALIQLNLTKVQAILVRSAVLNYLPTMRLGQASAILERQAVVDVVSPLEGIRNDLNDQLEAHGIEPRFEREL